jgi:hypothetical protein
VRRTLLSLAAALMLVVGTVGAAQAAEGPKRLLGNPSTACRVLVQYQAGGYTSFEDCMETINQDIAAYRFPANPEDPSSPLLSLSENCAMLEAGFTDPSTGETFQVTYPFFFDEPPFWPFPELTAYNHRQCVVTIYTYHTLASLFGG